MAGRCYYVSWVDLRTDPWPQWEQIRSDGSETLREGQRLRCLPLDHPQWPGVPLLEQAEPLVMHDHRMGRYVWPGIPLLLDGRPCRLYTGPTVSALFHPGSRFCNLAGLDAVYLLYQEVGAARRAAPEVRFGAPDLQAEGDTGPHKLLYGVLSRLCQARGVKLAERRIQLAPIKGISDPTDHAAIIQGIKHWVGHDDPFEFGAKRTAKNPPRIVINLSPGTPAMHAAWLLLRWNGTLGGAESVVEFVQGDGGLSERRADEGPPPDPLRSVPLDVLAQLVPRKGLGPQPTPDPEEGGVPLEELTCPPFDDLRQRIDHAAMLGLPILLQGERGTGKTFLAHYYHRRRQVYRGLAKEETAPSRSAGRTEAREATRKGNERFPEKAGASQFVAVTLSEFADLDTLRDTLFGWAKGSWTGAEKGFDGLLGEAHNGTLFLDEIHHLARPLQASLLGPLNCRRYRPKMAAYEVVSHFDLVVATNDPRWREKMADDFRDRIERIVLEVPAFRSFQRHGSEVLWHLWEFTLRRRCRECGIENNGEGPAWVECCEQLRGLFRRHPLAGNWRDLQRLADCLLLHLTSSREGRPSPIRWDRDKLEHAIAEAFAEN